MAVQSLGSGFIVHPAGYVITNAHVVSRATKVLVTLSDNAKYPARVISADPDHDLAVMQSNQDLADLTAIFAGVRPEVVYVHNPADKHDTHVAVCLRTLAAIRSLPKDKRPRRMLACEIWRDLDWLNDKDKQVLPVDRHKNLAAALSGVFVSQITGGKRYDAAVAGRRMAHATFFESHATDKVCAMSPFPLPRSSASWDLRPA